MKRFYWKENKEQEQQKQQEIKQILSQQLQSELVQDENKLILREARILVDNFSEEVMRKTASIIKNISFTPEEIIFQEGDNEDQNLYFIEKGSCEIFIEGNDKKQTLYEIQSGQYFGTTSFFTGLSRTCSIRSKGFSTLLFIKRDEFMEICKQSLPDYEKFCFLKDKILFENDFSIVNSQCYCCFQSHHQIQECQFLHYNNKSNFLNKLIEYEQNIQLKRVKIDKSKKNKSSSLIKLCTIQKLHKLFMRENQSILEEYEKNNFLQLIADMYDSEYYEEDSLTLLNEEFPYYSEANLAANEEINPSSLSQIRQIFQHQQSFNIKGIQKSVSLNNNPRQNYQPNHQNQQQPNQSFYQQNKGLKQNQIDYQKSESHNVLSDENIIKNNINVNFFTAAEPNYLQTQSTDRGRIESFMSTNQLKLADDNQIQIKTSSNELTTDQRSLPIISTILAINNLSNTNNNINYSTINKLKSNLQQGESSYADRSSLTLSKADLRSRNNSAFSNYSSQSPMNKKSQMFFNKMSQNFIEQNIEQESNGKQTEQNSMLHQEERQYNLDQNEQHSVYPKNHKEKTVKQLSTSSSQIQKLLPSKQNSLKQTSQQTQKAANALSTILKIKNMSKRIKNSFEKKKNNQEEIIKQNTISEKICNFSEPLSNMNEDLKQDDKINFELIAQSNQLFFFLMKHRNIVSYSTTQQIIDEQFEKMQDYTHYYPLGNSQIVTKLLSLSQKDRLKHYKRILELSKIEYRNSNTRNVNSISRLKNKFQQEQNSMMNFHKINNIYAEDSKPQTYNEIFKDIDGDSYSQILNQNNITNLHLKQHFSQIVNQNPKRRKTSASYKFDQQSCDTDMQVPKSFTNIQNTNQVSVHSASPIQNSNQKKSFPGSPFLFSRQNPQYQISNLALANESSTEKQQLYTKPKYEITTIKEIDQQQKDMEYDLHCFSLIPDAQNSFNITIPNLSVMNQKEYLTDI